MLSYRHETDIPNSHVPDACSGSGTLATGLLQGSAVLVYIAACLVHSLQSVLNVEARLIYHLCPHDHFSDVLVTLHWLDITEHVQQ